MYIYLGNTVTYNRHIVLFLVDLTAWFGMHVGALFSLPHESLLLLFFRPIDLWAFLSIMTCIVKTSIYYVHTYILLLGYVSYVFRYLICCRGSTTLIKLSLSNLEDLPLELSVWLDKLSRCKWRKGLLHPTPPSNVYINKLVRSLSLMHLVLIGFWW